MPSAPPSRSLGMPRRFAAASAMVAAVTLLGALLPLAQLRWTQENERAIARERAEHRAAQLASAAADRVGALVRNVDFVLLEVRRAFSVQPATFGTLVEALAQSFPERTLLQISLADAEGWLTYSNLGLAGRVSIRDREHFQAHLEGGDRLFVSKPLLGRVSKQWTIQFTRPILRDGRFAGVAVVSLAPQVLTGVLGRLASAQEDIVSLFHADGSFLARSPELEAMLGKSLPVPRPFMRADAPPGGVYRARATTDARSRLFGWQRIEGTTLVANVGIDEATEFAPLERHFERTWNNALWFAAGLAILGGGVVSLLWSGALRSRALAESETRFRQLTALSSDWYWEQDADLRFTFLSTEVRDRSGIAVSEHLGRTRWDLPALNLSEEDWERHRAQLERREPFRNFVMRFEDRDGREHWVSVSGDPLFDAAGRFSGYRGTGREITQRVLLERALEASEARFRDIARATGDWFWETDAEGRFVWLSETVRDATGVAPDWHYGKTRAELAARSEDIGQEPWKSHFEAQARREPFRDFRYRRRGPTADQWLSTSGVPVFGTGGEFHGYRGSASNVTREVELERRAQAADEALKRAIEELNEPVAITDADDRIVVSNRAFREVNANIPAYWAGCTYEEHLRAGLAAGNYPGAAGRETDWLAERLARRRSGVVGLEVARQDGRWLLVSDQQLPGGGIITYSLDITDRKRAEAALHELNETLEHRVAERTADLAAVNRELEAFSYTVAHDLRAPLRGVNGFAHILMEDHAAELSAPARQLLGRIAAAALSMGEMIDGVLEMSRLGRTELQLRELDMGMLVRAVVQELKVNSGAGASIEIGDLAPARGDATLLRQVWHNLIGNALKFSADAQSPQVWIGSRREPGRLVYWVRDNGAGFDPAYAAKLFGLFQRLHSPAEYPGTGLGLAIVRRAVERHGGSVRAEGTPGEGATFYFALPRS